MHPPPLAHLQINSQFFYCGKDMTFPDGNSQKYLLSRWASEMTSSKFNLMSQGVYCLYLMGHS